MRRNLARVFALLALAAAALAILLVVQGSGGSSSNDGTTITSPKTSKAGRTHRAATKRHRPAKKTPRVYIVRSGDTLLRIAERTHVSVSVIQELNPNLDPTTLQTGQKIKLRS